MPDDKVYYKGYRISQYISRNHQFRWIYEENEWIDPVAEFNLQEKHVSVEDCKRIIDGWVKDKESRKPEQMTLF